MKTYTIAEYAKLTGKSVVAIYKGKGYKRFITVINGKKSIVIPDNIDPLTLEEVGEILNPVLNPVINPLNPSGMAAEAPQRPSDGGAEADRANTHPPAAPASTDAQQALQEELEQMTRERDELRREAASREQLIAAKEETLRTMQAQVGDLQAEVARLREDLDRERAAHQDDRQRDRETLEQALREAHARQHELSVLLLQEQNRHKPLRLLLAEKAESIFHKTKRKESANHDEDE